MEASGSYERPWTEALRKAGIDAEMIAWFAETFATGAEPMPDPERDALDRLVTARALLVRLSTRIGRFAEHRPPRIVANARTAITRTIAAPSRGRAFTA